MPVGPFKGVGGVLGDRRISEDEAAIRLNPTMVGFGAGESTFGWIFYPRLQTSRTPYNVPGRHRSPRTSCTAELPSLGDKEQSIEPGQRECTALIMMPNYIPKIELVTVANWFRTSELNDRQTADIERASDLASRFVEAEEMLNRTGRPRSAAQASSVAEEFQIASERLNQLKSLMPTQRLVVRVPFTGDGNDSRIFCSRGGQLRPALLAWHGKPPEAGVESTIFLEGKNFSVHDTHVIAGGKPAESVLVSRNIMEVTISKDATGDPRRRRRPAHGHQRRHAQRRVEPSADPHAAGVARPERAAENPARRLPRLPSRSWSDLPGRRPRARPTPASFEPPSPSRRRRKRNGNDRRSPLRRPARERVVDAGIDGLGIGRRSHPTPDLGDDRAGVAAEPRREIAAETMVEPRDLDQPRGLAVRRAGKPSTRRRPSART